MDKIRESSFLIMENATIKKKGLKTLNKALALLEFLSINEKETRKGTGVSEINEVLHLGLSTIHRMLTTFKMRGYITQNQKTMKYFLGIKLFELSYTVQNTKYLIETTKSYLKQLSQSIGETANLAILEGKEVIYIAKIESSEVLTTNIKIGARLPANCTALGKILLAFMPEKEFDNLYEDNKVLPSLSPNSITSLKELKKQLIKAKEQGYAIDKEEYRIGVNCVAVPIKDKTGNTIAAISLTGPASRFTLEEIEKKRSYIIRISKEISNNI